MLGKQQVNPSPFNHFSFQNFSVEGLADKKVTLNRIFFHSKFQYTKSKFPESQNCFFFPKGKLRHWTHWRFGWTGFLIFKQFRLGRGSFSFLSPSFGFVFFNPVHLFLFFSTPKMAEIKTERNRKEKVRLYENKVYQHRKPSSPNLGNASGVLEAVGKSNCKNICMQTNRNTQIFVA